MNLLKWKFQALYLSAVGIANIGQWIYLLAINLMVYEMTGSALAVAGLYMIKPFAHMFVGLWAGSVIDRVSTKHLMITLDVIRASLIVLIPFLDSIWIIYGFVLFIQMAGAMFDPASFKYMTLLLPKHDRKRFNALISFVHSGAFVMGPALAGILFIIGSLEMALFVNVGTFLLSAVLTSLLPIRFNTTSSEKTNITWSDIRTDWHLVWNFSKKALPFVVVYMVFQGVMLLTAALDSMEVAFAKDVLQLSDAAYGSLVSLAGVGFLMGAICTNLIVKFTSSKQLMGIGIILVAVGYLIYSFSTTYLMASIGFFILSYFLSFANTGFMTFIQENIPITIMGRIYSLYAMVSSSIQILVILLLGFAAQLVSVQEVVIGGSILMFGVACFLTLLVKSSLSSDYVTE
ncbi:MFS transporter [Paenisporosarcina sp. TG-14]|uniref:MFS transporter n=1 Tax=Paenisporosarcina sp. TG-14 TaxID=1231057 RepID=UPI0002F2E1B4|nr:MFS transporter [Paenisporosarcina sp. TG-14]